MRLHHARRQKPWTPLFSLLLSLCLAPICVAAAAAGDATCVVHQDGKVYDLNPLASKTDYQITTQKGRKLYLNICQSVKTETFGLKDDSVLPSEIGAFIRRDHGDFSLGKANTSLNVINASPRIVMSQGSQCPSGGNAKNRAATLVNFVCDSSVVGAGSPQIIGSLPPGDEDAACAFIIEWKTPYSCGISETGGFWNFLSTIFVILFILLAAYTILGTQYNQFVLHLKGLDSIPQFSFQSMRYHVWEAFEWTKDVLGILLVNYCTSSGGGGGSGGRNPSVLPSHSANPRMPNPVSHQAQVQGIINSESQRPVQTGEVFPTTAQQQSQHSATNPVSHHTQTMQSSNSLINPLPAHPPTTTTPQTQMQTQSHTTPAPAPDSPSQTPHSVQPAQSIPAPSSQEGGQFLLYTDEEQDRE